MEVEGLLSGCALKTCKLRLVQRAEETTTSIPRSEGGVASIIVTA